MTPEEIGELVNQYMGVLRSAQTSPRMFELEIDCVNQMSELLYSQNTKAEKQGQKVELNVVLKKPPVNLLVNEGGDTEDQSIVLKGVRFIGFKKMPNRTTDSIPSRWHIITEQSGIYGPIQSFDAIDNIENIGVSIVPLKNFVAAS